MNDAVDGGDLMSLLFAITILVCPVVGLLRNRFIKFLLLAEESFPFVGEGRAFCKLTVAKTLENINVAGAPLSG